MRWTYRKYSKIQVLKRLYHVTTKNLFPQTIPAKIFSTNQRNTVKLDIAKNLSLNSFGTSWGNSWTKFIILDTSIILLMVIRTYTKLPKCPKKYDEDSLKVFLCSILFRWWSNFLEKVSILAQNVSLFIKQLISNNESLLKSNFYLNQG